MFYNTTLRDEGGRSSLRNIVLLDKSETLRKSVMRVTSRHVTDEPECTEEKSFVIYNIFVYCNWVVTRWQWLFYM